MFYFLRDKTFGIKKYFTLEKNGQTSSVIYLEYNMMQFSLPTTIFLPKDKLVM